ncbi:MAG: hypothetical protein ACRDKK_05220 [Gaiellaceae bacterium]
MAENPLPDRVEVRESRWEAASAVGIVISFQLLLAIVSGVEDVELWGLPWWVWLVPVGPELALVIPLVWERTRNRLEQAGRRRTVAVALIAVISLTNAVLLAVLLGSILSGHENSGRLLLLKGAAVWSTNVIAFALLFWELDRGGPVRRLAADPPGLTFSSPKTSTPSSPSRAGLRTCWTTPTSRSRTRLRSAPLTRCR